MGGPLHGMPQYFDLRRMTCTHRYWECLHTSRDRCHCCRSPHAVFILVHSDATAADPIPEVGWVGTSWKMSICGRLRCALDLMPVGMEAHRCVCCRGAREHNIALCIVYSILQGDM